MAMKMKVILSAALAVGLVSVATPAKAALITGSFGIGGSVTYDNLLPITGTPGDAGLDFIQCAGGVVSPCTPHVPPPTSPTGGFVETTVATGYFFSELGMGPVVTTPGGTFGTVGQILNIANVTGGGVDPDYTLALPNTPIDVEGFLRSFVNLNPISGNTLLDLRFDLEFIPNQVNPNSCPPLVGDVCVDGPFKLSETAEGIDVAFDVIGTFYANNDQDSGRYIGNFTWSIAGLDFEELGALLDAGSDIACGPNFTTQPCAFAATFQPFDATAVPEPATMTLFGLGSLALAASRKRLAKKNKQ